MGAESNSQSPSQTAEDAAEGGAADLERNGDAGALFVLESKGNWVHVGYHLSTSIAAPAILSLPFAFAGLGWAPGLISLAVGAAVSFYSYSTMSRVLEHLASKGRRHIRFREMAGDILGPRWNRLLVAPTQFLVCFGSVIGCTILGGQSMKFIYDIYHSEGGPIRLYEFIVLFGAVMMILSQLPSFHSLRYINFLSLLMCLGYTICVVGGSIYAGHSKLAPAKDYNVSGSKTSKMFGVFNSLAVISTTYGNSIIPEIQATLAPPVTGKMLKGLCICYAVVLSTFFSISISGYWAFGNNASGNIFSNFAPKGSQALIPNWLLFMANMFVLTQLFAVALVYSQPTFEVLEGRSSDASTGMFSFRNVLPRLILRCFYIALATLISAMLPFFGDMNAIIGAFGFTPLDFVLPMVFSNIVFQPRKRQPFLYWLNNLIALAYSIIGLLGCIAAVRQVALDAKSYKLFANV